MRRERKASENRKGDHLGQVISNIKMEKSLPSIKQEKHKAV